MTLAELKRTLTKGAKYRVVKHYVLPELDGEIRTVNKVQTNGIYSTNGDNDTCNGGLGRWTAWGKAKDWKFNSDGTIENYFKNGEPIMIIEIL